MKKERPYYPKYTLSVKTDEKTLIYRTRRKKSVRCRLEKIVNNNNTISGWFKIEYANDFFNKSRNYQLPKEEETMKEEWALFLAEVDETMEQFK